MKLYTLILAAMAVLTFLTTQARAENPITVRLTIGQEEVLIDLLDNPAAKEFAAQLPLTLPFNDFAGAEKIATLPKRLSPQNSPTGRELPADFTYYMPWGNLAVFYNGVGDNGQLLALGNIRTGKAVLASQHKDFTATMEVLKP